MSDNASTESVRAILIDASQAANSYEIWVAAVPETYVRVQAESGGLKTFPLMHESVPKAALASAWVRPGEQFELTWSRSNDPSTATTQAWLVVGSASTLAGPLAFLIATPVIPLASGSVISVQLSSEVSAHIVDQRIAVRWPRPQQLTAAIAKPSAEDGALIRTLLRDWRVHAAELRANDPLQTKLRLRLRQSAAASATRSAAVSLSRSRSGWFIADSSGARSRVQIKAADLTHSSQRDAASMRVFYDFGAGEVTFRRNPSALMITSIDPRTEETGRLTRFTISSKRQSAHRASEVEREAETGSGSDA